MALINSERIILKAGSDADDARWFVLKTDNTVKDTKLLLSNEETELSAVITTKPDDFELQILENNGLAFDHAEIIICALNRLRAKLEYTDLAFSLISEKFTLTELQQVYEVVLGKPLYKAAFRRKVKNLVEEINEYTKNSGHRPSQKFRRRKEQEQ